MPAFIEPDTLCVQLQPGEARLEAVTIGPVASAQRWSAALVDKEDFANITRLLEVRTFRRPATEEEIRELPPIPPSIREHARRHGIDEREEIEHPPGTPVSLDAKSSLIVWIQFSAPIETVEGIRIGRLALKSGPDTGFDVAIFCVVGRAVATPTIEPAQIRVALRPGETATRSAMIAHVPTSDRVIATVIGGRGMIRVSHLVATREVRRPATPEELADLPPALRELVEREGFIEYEEVARSDGKTPLNVNAGTQLFANVEFGSPTHDMREIVDALLVIDSPRWQRATVPLRMMCGEIGVRLENDAVTVTQGKSTEILATISCPSGPGGLVSFNLINDEDRLQVFPESVAIEPRTSKSFQLAIGASNDAPLGTLHATFVAWSFEDLQSHLSDLRVEIVPGDLKLFLRPTSLTVRQGDSVAFEAIAISESGRKRIVLEPGDLPPGVHIDRAEFFIGPESAAHAQAMRVSIDADAPLAHGAWVPIRWSVNDGMLAGLLNLPTTIELRPDSRRFSREITTPPGTALGGWAELEIHNDGRIVFSGHMHGSGFDPYAFRIGYFLRGVNLSIVLSDVLSGRVGGTIGGGSRDHDWRVETHSPLLKAHWRAFRDGNAEFTKWYEDTGVLGSLGDIAQELTKFLTLTVLSGPALGATVVFGPELARIFELPGPRVSRIAGAVILGGIVLLPGPLAAVPAVVVGIDQLTDGAVKSRRMHDTEIAEARRVFGDTLPIDRIRVINLQGRTRGTDTVFTMLNAADNTILIGMGPFFDGDLVGNGDFIHELTHAWQHEHRAFSLEDLWGDIEKPFLSGEALARLYLPPEDGRPWRNVHSEGQAKTVELWYRECFPDLESERARSHRHFHYIANNLRTGNP